MLRRPSAQDKKGARISLVNSRAEALGYKTRRSPGCFCRALRMVFRPGYPFLPTRASILSRARHASGRQSESSAAKQRETFEGKECDALHDNPPLKRCSADVIDLACRHDLEPRLRGSDSEGRRLSPFSLRQRTDAQRQNCSWPGRRRYGAALQRPSPLRYTSAFRPQYSSEANKRRSIMFGRLCRTGAGPFY